MGRFSLGLNASHNGAACLFEDDNLIVAVQEERLKLSKNCRLRGAAESLAVRYCLDSAGIEVSDLSSVTLCVQGDAKTDSQNLVYNRQLALIKHSTPFGQVSHHYAHALSAVYRASATGSVDVLVLDGAGSLVRDLPSKERNGFLGDGLDYIEGGSYYRFHGLDSYEVIHKDFQPSGQGSRQERGMLPFGTLGNMYASVALQIFGDLMDSGKVMGLAPFGSPEIPVSEFLTIRDGKLRFSRDVCSRFCGDERWPQLSREYETLAASVQVALEEAVLSLVASRFRHGRAKSLCFAGGVALNCTLNEKIKRQGLYERVFFMPNADDAGVAIGAAVAGVLRDNRPVKAPPPATDFLGHVYSQGDITDAINSFKPIVRETDSSQATTAVAAMISSGAICGWFNRGSEFGPRALGARSILADGRQPSMKQVLNERVKCREQFRPFAPVVLAEAASEWFELKQGDNSPFMMRAVQALKRTQAEVPSVVHVDGTSRIQTVGPEDGSIYDVTRAFYEITGIPILLNTSFNVMGQAIVETPSSALLELAVGTIDVLYLQGRILASDQQMLQSASIRAVDYVANLTLSSKEPMRRLAKVTIESHWGKVEVAAAWEDVVVIQRLLSPVSFLEACELATSTLGVSPEVGRQVVLRLLRNGLLKLGV